MLRIQRLGLVWSTTIFFLVASPILGIYALGYDFDFKKNNLNNTVTLSVETAPDKARIDVIGQQPNTGNSLNPITSNTVFESNSDVRIASKNQLKLNISKDGYLFEDFWVKGKQSDNSLVRLKKINLLPLESQKLANAGSDWSDINFVSKDYIYFTKKVNGISSIFLQQYSYGGFLGDLKPVQVFQPLNDQLNLELPINLDQQPDVNLQNIPSNSFWEELDFETFWQKDTQSLLFKNSKGDWQIWQSQFLGLGNLDLIWLGQNIVLLHDRQNTKNVYKYDLNKDLLSYITDNITAISLNNNQIWFWFQDKLYKINKEEIDSLSSVNWSKKPGYDLKNFEGFDLVKLYNKLNGNYVPDFKIKNQYQGVVAYINGQIYYQTDSQSDKWSLIATDVKYWTSTWHSIFWINSNRELQTYNLELKYQRLVAVLDLNFDQDELINLDYYAGWHRLFIYKKTKNDSNSELRVDSIWYNPDFVNEGIRTFSQKNWLNEPVCRAFVEGGYMFCFDKDQNLISYRNLY